jgi:hypothetical protein
MALVQVGCAAKFVRLFRRPLPAPVPDAMLPRAAILLSLRGADPFLAPCLRRLMRQNYPAYEIRIVVDHEEDPAMQVVRETIRDMRATNIRLSTLGQVPETCSPKCHASVQMASELDDSCEVVVLADADVVTHADWLRELIAPLLEEGVGATHGNRWYMPREGCWGSLVRYVWNTMAVVPMYLLEIPWGGTFAMRVSVLRDAGVLEHWSRAVVEDLSARAALERQGLRVRFVPALMMVNREECELGFSLDFIKRQLTWCRLYHPYWPAVALHAFATMAGLLAVIGIGAWAIARGAWPLALGTGGSLLGYLGIMLLVVGWMEVSVRRSVRAHGEPATWLAPRTLVRLLLALPLTQIVHCVAVLLAIFRRQVAWRGVTYCVRGRWNVRMAGYVPYQQPVRPAESNTSL